MVISILLLKICFEQPVHFIIPKIIFSSYIVAIAFPDHTNYITIPLGGIKALGCFIGKLIITEFKTKKLSVAGLPFCRKIIPVHAQHPAADIIITLQFLQRLKDN